MTLDRRRFVRIRAKTAWKAGHMQGSLQKMRININLLLTPSRQCSLMSHRSNCFLELMDAKRRFYQN